METTIVYLGYIEIMEKKMETAAVYFGYIGIIKEYREEPVARGRGCLRASPGAETQKTQPKISALVGRIRTSVICCCFGLVLFFFVFWFYLVGCGL